MFNDHAHEMESNNMKCSPMFSSRCLPNTSWVKKLNGSKFQTTLMSASHVYNPPAEDAVMPSGALHHPREGQELGSGNGTPSMVQDPPAEDATMHSGVLRHPHKDPELVGSLPVSTASSLSTILLTWELSEASVGFHQLVSQLPCLMYFDPRSHRTLHKDKLRTAVKYHLPSIGGIS
jgi:hypothetical protein